MQPTTPKQAKLNPQKYRGSVAEDYRTETLVVFSSRLGTPTVLELEARKGIGLCSKIIAKRPMSLLIGKGTWIPVEA